MSEDLTPWLVRIVDDLAEFGSDLLQAGLTPRSQARSMPTYKGSAPLRAILRAVDMFCRRVPRLLEELESEQNFLMGEWVSSPTPRQAIQATHPGDYTFRDGRLLPRRWLRLEPVPELRQEPLRWVTGVANRLAERLQLQLARLEKARQMREGDSIYALKEIECLDTLVHEIGSARHRLELSQALLFRRAGRRFTGSSRMPHPFPCAPLWQAFRREVQQHQQEARSQLAPWLRELRDEGADMAEAPFLYQRWCGLQIIQASARLGWQAEGDIVGSLFLGGAIALIRGQSKVQLWVEPRLGTAQAGPIGWRSARRGQELTPDFLFVWGQAGHRDAFVLDATLATGSDTREDRDKLAQDKSRYRNLLVGEDSRQVAGRPLVRRPLRSWAMAPINRNTCYLGPDMEGWSGIVPVNANSNDFSGLEAWLSDLFGHAKAAHAAQLPATAWTVTIKNETSPAATDCTDCNFQLTVQSQESAEYSRLGTTSSTG